MLLQRVMGVQVSAQAMRRKRIPMLTGKVALPVGVGRNYLW